ncbi:MAG TPA: c-type cytochrome, partial [Blastocatellia bacterium]|nr:c-type cytochrome [Blastocatellia bacterium]
AGWGGSFPLTGGSLGLPVASGRLLTFALNGKGQLETFAAKAPKLPEALELTASAETVSRGGDLFAQYCAVCHGIAALGGGGVLPDLKYSAPATFNSYQKILLDGALLGEGMPSFKQSLTPADVDAIRAYVISQRNGLTAKK